MSEKKHSAFLSPRLTLLPGTSLLAWRNLTHERGRFVITLIGIVFSVVLMGVQLGLLLGFTQTTSGLIDHSDADLWITPSGTTNVDISGTQATRWRQVALATPGVVAADLYLVQFAFWKRPDGSAESSAVVGFNLATLRGKPWNIVAGSIDDLQQDDAVMIDELYKEKLGITALNQTVEINGRRVRIVGFTRGIRTFTQSPYVFTTYRNALHLTRTNERKTNYILVDVDDGNSPATVKAALQQKMPFVDVWTREEFSAQTKTYWMVTTGAGSAILMAAFLGLVVGIVIVGQTLYASTMDRIAEYATLCAMGASSHYLRTVVIKQALISAVFGYAIGMAVTLFFSYSSQQSNVLIAMPLWAIAVLGVLTIAMCLLGATASIRRINTIDPCSVFK